MKRAAAVLAFLLACDAGPKASPVPRDASPVVGNTITLPPVTIITPRQPRRVLIVGDSEACAVSGYTNLKKLVWEIDDETGQPHDDIHVSCKGGTTVQYWGAGNHLRLALSQYPKPDDVLVFLGTNHYWQKAAPPTNTVTDLLKDTHCIWVGNTAVHGKHWAINGFIRDAVTPQCTYLDTEAANIALADGVHPTLAGAAEWIRLVWKMIPPKYEEADQ